MNVFDVIILQQEKKACSNRADRLIKQAQRTMFPVVRQRLMDAATENWIRTVQIDNTMHQNDRSW